MEDTKIFSIVIPVYNAEFSLERTIASLISNKDFIHEIIIVDDHSTDKGIDKLIPYFKIFPNLKVIDSEGEHSPSVARLTGLEHSSGKWITFVDSDDCLTPSSLYYVYKYLQEFPETLLLHSKTIYYESGVFNKDTIEYSDYSCGGNFYQTKFLKNNQLYPHKDLKMAEDEYFNELVSHYITYLGLYDKIEHFDYPVYEVHHDFDNGLSFALSNWEDYVCKYHLLYKQELYNTLFEKLTNNNNIFKLDFQELLQIMQSLQNELIENFIFCYFNYQGLLVAEDSNQDKVFNQLPYFKRYIEQNKIDIQDYIDYYNQNSSIVEEIYNGSCSSVGSNFEISMNFENFIKNFEK